jgi:hypothetical protein
VAEKYDLTLSLAEFTERYKYGNSHKIVKESLPPADHCEEASDFCKGRFCHHHDSYLPGQEKVTRQLCAAHHLRWHGKNKATHLPGWDDAFDAMYDYNVRARTLCVETVEVTTRTVRRG